MDNQNKASIDGMENQGTEVKVANRKTVRSSDFLLRLLAIATTLAATIVMSLANETKTVPYSVLPNLPPVNVSVIAKWQYSSAFQYFLVSNAIACAYALFSLVLLIANRAGGPNNIEILLCVLDLVMVALLNSSGGAASAIGIVGYNGNSHLQWKKVCNVFEGFCHHSLAAIAISMIGSLSFVLLIVLTILNLRKKSR